MRKFFSILAIIFMFNMLSVSASAATEEETLLALINSARAENGLGALSLDKELTRAASIRATECAVLFSHTRPDGTDFYTVSSAAYGENLSKANSYNTLEEVFAAWMASPSHRANILYGASTKTGFGIFKSGDVYYVTEEFN
ncbi:MAG: CAP domain-containing protein [Butyrivibrio sp.]|uniref:CAP domain-containing protein n=1 Tax=Butyrivibrio sp. TaxID=28121 RepID=UPI001B44CD2B|nr:CAP domain-containing protein [Butyrivibrio sp.]MBP3781708.1 CAP domain-containing protein [Butyrivibrio sp.]